MKRLLIGVLCSWLAVSAAPAMFSVLAAATTDAREQSATETVYVTKTGEKYHRDGCRSLAKSAIPMSLKEASQRYGACKNCKPPVLRSTSAAPVSAPLIETARPAPAGSSARPQSTRCAATTKKGTQCSRTAKAGNSYCWQHGG